MANCTVHHDPVSIQRQNLSTISAHCGLGTRYQSLQDVLHDGALREVQLTGMALVGRNQNTTRGKFEDEPRHICSVVYRDWLSYLTAGGDGQDHVQPLYC